MAARLSFLLLACSLLAAQTPFFPLSEVRPGLHGVGRTVFAGGDIAEFDVEILGVLENSGPKQSVILARLSGGPLERTGVLQGMSGSPVYIDGRLLGAVALGFEMSTEPIAGIRPIEEMIRPEAPASARAGEALPLLWAGDLTAGLPEPPDYLAGGARLLEIATPVAFSGFTRGTLDQFAPQLRRLGLEPRQGVSGGGNSADAAEGAQPLRPGSMISVQLLQGDLSVGADGTVTYIDGDRIYAFGHQFLSVGNTSLPFHRAEVLALAPNLSSSFKISAVRELKGAITSDYSTGVTGLLGQRAATIPITIRVTGAGGARHSEYRMEMADDRYLSPILLQMAIYSSIQATERTIGTSTVAVRGQVDFAGDEPPVRIDDMYAGDSNVPQQASLGVALPVAYLLQCGFDSLKVRSISLDIDAYDELRQRQIDQVWPVRDSVEPGEDIELMVVLTGENGAEETRKVTYRVPPGEPPGTLHFTVADGSTTNLLEYRFLAGRRMQTASQVIDLLNGLRSDTGIYVRVWRAEGSYVVAGRQLPAPPPSIALVLGRNQSSTAAAQGSFTSKIREIRLDAGDMVVTGSRTVQVEVTE